MSERKLYLAGIGGNRYETTLEELKKQAFEGKIKRKDKIIVSEVVDEQAKEYVVLCEKVKGLEKYFIRGEMERTVEKRRKAEEKEAVKRAREKEKEEARARKEEERIVARKEQAEREKAERERVISAAERAFGSETTGDEASEEKSNSSITEESFAKVEETISSLAQYATAGNVFRWLAILVLVLYGLRVTGADDELLVFVGGIGLLGVFGAGFLFHYAKVLSLRLPLQIAEFQVDAFRSIIENANDLATYQRMGMEIAKTSSSSANKVGESESLIPQNSTLDAVPVPPREI